MRFQCDEVLCVNTLLPWYSFDTNYFNFRNVEIFRFFFSIKKCL
jgi:hypothetical protein